MVTRYSQCHFAEVMNNRAYTKTMTPQYIEVTTCSWCGKKCELVPMPFTLREDIELTLRRWKDGDCSLDDMFDRLNKEYRRAWNEVFEIAEKRLRRGKPKYVRPDYSMVWVKAEDAGNDLAAADKEVK